MFFFLRIMPYSITQVNLKTSGCSRKANGALPSWKTGSNSASPCCPSCARPDTLRNLKVPSHVTVESCGMKLLVWGFSHGWFLIQSVADLQPITVLVLYLYTDLTVKYNPKTSLEATTQKRGNRLQVGVGYRWNHRILDLTSCSYYIQVEVTVGIIVFTDIVQ